MQDVSGNRVHDTGWNVERFLSDVEDYTCSICYGVFRNAATMACGHTFCGECIYTQNRCPLCRMQKSDRVPDYSKRMAIMGLSVSCSHTHCPVTGSLRAMIGHELVCIYRNVACIDCQKLVTSKDLQGHQESCEHRKKECIKCHQLAIISSIHLCPQDEINCEKCPWTGIRLEKENHDKTCIHKNIFCPLTRYGCNWFGERRLVMNHLEQEDHLVRMSQSIEERLTRIGAGL